MQFSIAYFLIDPFMSWFHIPIAVAMTENSRISAISRQKPQRISSQINPSCFASNGGIRNFEIDNNPYFFAYLLLVMYKTRIDLEYPCVSNLFLQSSPDLGVSNGMGNIYFGERLVFSTFETALKKLAHFHSQSWLYIDVKIHYNSMHFEIRQLCITEKSFAVLKKMK